MSSLQEEKPSEKPRIPDIRNAELVSRLLAATPPYLYGALPLQPHAYFFSEMLRSFVQARHGCRAPPPHPTRRLKKRGPKYFAGDDPKADWQRRVCDPWKVSHPPEEKVEVEEPEQTRAGDIPLELTVEKQARRSRELSPRHHSPKVEPPKSSGSPSPPAKYLDVGTDEGAPKPAPCLRSLPADQIPPSNLILPPPPPMWYPPLYNPPFGVDPLNFFIDLRVSGHIYDRKRAAGEAGLTADIPVPDKRHDPMIGGERRFPGHRPRHASAFSVPTRTHDSAAKYYDQSSGNTEGTPYVMRNLKRIYESVKTKSADDKGDADDSATKVEVSDCTDVDDDGAQN